MKEPLISIIVPVYNVEKYLTKCISSIVQQTYDHIQIILVDDGSTDNSGKICDESAQSDVRIDVLHKENGGLVSARKAGLNIARGNYIGFVDGDDYINANMYEELLYNIISSEADFVHSGYLKDTSPISQISSKVVNISENKGEFINYYILSGSSKEHMSYSIWSKLFRADFIKKCYSEVPTGVDMGEDMISLLACVLNGKRVSILDSAYYCYNVRNTSITQKKRDTALLDVIKLYGAVEDILKKYHCYDDVKGVLVKDWLTVEICSSLNRLASDEFIGVCYKIRCMQELLGKKIVLYGAGRIGRDYYSQVCRYSECQIVAWVDINYQRFHFGCIEVVGRERLAELDYDILLIAVKEEKTAMQIKRSLIEESGVKEEKIMWQKPVHILADV